MEFFSGLPAWLQALFATLFTYGMTAAGASLVFLSKRLNKTVLTATMGLAAGIMIAASFFSLLLPAMERAEVGGRGEASLILTIGFLAGGAFIMISDAVLCRMEKFRSKENRGGVLMCAAMTLHNIPEGFAVGVAFGCVAGEASALVSAVMLALGIGIQNFPEGLIVSMPLYRAGKNKGRAFLEGTLSGIVEPIGAVIAFIFVSMLQSLLPLLLSFAAGAMFYVVVEELIPEASEGEHSNIGTIGAAEGFALMMVLDGIFG